MPRHTLTHRQICVYGTAAWADWVEDTSDTLGVYPCDLIAKSLAAYAEKKGFRAPPPRIGSRRKPRPVATTTTVTATATAVTRDRGDHITSTRRSH
jgi:hypothetical protein